MGDRIQVALVCSVCERRNYKATRRPDQKGQFEIKKFCPGCKVHTLHRETK